jgi:gliding motility-associated-like protein
MAGVYSVTASDSICTTIATTSVTVYPPVVLTGITADCSIAPGSTVQLDAAGAVMYLWSPHDGSLSNPNINNPVARPQQTTTYMVVGMNTLGCSDTAWVKVTVSGRDSFFIPDAFTPDGDGLNDVFHIRCADGYKLAEMAIYNRWGQLVYQGFGADCGWDGTWNNTAQDLGVYYFSATITTPSGNSRQPKGNITLIR